SRSARRRVWRRRIWSCTVLQHGSKLLERLVDVGARRGLVAAEARRDLTVPEALELPQHERRALSRRQRLHRTGHGPELLAILEGWRTAPGEAVELDLDHPSGATRATPRHAARRVRRDAEEPRPHVRTRPQAAERAVRVQEGLLAGVLRLLGIPQEAQQVAQDLVPVALREFPRRRGGSVHRRIFSNAGWPGT